MDRSRVERLRQFIASERFSESIGNVNQYWVKRQRKLSTVVHKTNVEVFGDSNLNTKVDSWLYWALKVSPRIVRVFAKLIPRYRSVVQSAAEGLTAYDRLRVCSSESFVNHFEGLKVDGLDHILGHPIVGPVFWAWPQRTLIALRALDSLSKYLSEQNSGDRVRVIEIGAGPGICALLLKTFLNAKVVIVDLPEQIVVGYSLVSQVLGPQGITVSLPHEIDRDSSLIQSSDFVFITPEQLHLLHADHFNAAINVTSFQEMSPDTVAQYFSFLRTHLAKEQLLYSLNRVSKTNAHDGTVSKAASYPWSTEDATLHSVTIDPRLAGLTIAQGPLDERVVRLS